MRQIMAHLKHFDFRFRPTMGWDLNPGPQGTEVTRSSKCATSNAQNWEYWLIPGMKGMST